MKLHFNPNHEHQLNAIKAVVRVFEGQPDGRSDFSLVAESGFHPEAQFANRLSIAPEQILKNTQAVQGENKLKKSESLGDDGLHFFVV